MPIDTMNPATGEVLHSYPIHSNDDVSDIINKAHDAFSQWRTCSFEERAKPMKRVAELLKANAADYAKIITAEMGKPITAATAEVEKCAWICEYYADTAAEHLAPEHVEVDAIRSYRSYEPSGVIFAIMPWNYPMWQVFRFLAPNLMAGHACLLKHAPISTGAALLMEDLIKEAGFPENLFRALIIETEQAAQVIDHPHVSGVTLTGSERAGRAVGSAAGHAIKPVVLELGGSDPYLILEDACVDKATTACVSSRLNNSGQVCIAAKRILIVDSLYDEFKAQIIEKMSAYSYGDPTNPDTQMGPLARADLRETVHQQVTNSIAGGCTLVMGGEIPEGPGFYYPPTLLTDIQPDTPAATEEIFGPVILLFRVKNEEDALRIANDSPYGLSAAVFTEDLAKGERIAHEIVTGVCFVNDLVRSDPRLPFGGTKLSGIGRECAREGIRSFMNRKSIVIKD